MPMGAKLDSRVEAFPFSLRATRLSFVALNFNPFLLSKDRRGSERRWELAP